MVLRPEQEAEPPKRSFANGGSILPSSATPPTTSAFALFIRATWSRPICRSSELGDQAPEYDRPFVDRSPDATRRSRRLRPKHRQTTSARELFGANRLGGPDHVLAPLRVGALRPPTSRAIRWCNGPAADAAVIVRIDENGKSPRILRMRRDAALLRR